MLCRYVALHIVLPPRLVAPSNRTCWSRLWLDEERRPWKRTRADGGNLCSAPIRARLGYVQKSIQANKPAHTRIERMFDASKTAITSLWIQCKRDGRLKLGEPMMMPPSHLPDNFRILPVYS